jgi:hypothetical protein
VAGVGEEGRGREVNHKRRKKNKREKEFYRGSREERRGEKRGREEFWTGLTFCWPAEEQDVEKRKKRGRILSTNGHE